MPSSRGEEHVKPTVSTVRLSSREPGAIRVPGCRGEEHENLRSQLSEPLREDQERYACPALAVKGQCLHRGRNGRCMGLACTPCVLSAGWEVQIYHRWVVSWCGKCQAGVRWGWSWKRTRSEYLVLECQRKVLGARLAGSERPLASGPVGHRVECLLSCRNEVVGHRGETGQIGVPVVVATVVVVATRRVFSAVQGDDRAFSPPTWVGQRCDCMRRCQKR